jgi:two-component system sensor histidine kinase PilS (NtrC family)
LARLFPGFVDEAQRGETEWSGPDGRRRVLGFTGFSLGGDRGRARGQAVIFQDLTGLRAMEEAVRRSERLADLGMVAAGLAHELRNPLASMSGSVELLQAAPGLGADEGRLLGIVLKEAARLEQLVTRFLDYSRPAPPRHAEVDLPQLLGELVEVFSHDPVAARMRIERQFEPATLRCDPGQIRQVVWNLLVNAAQALQGQPGGGAIRLSCARLETGGVRVVVEDDGPGIAASDLPRLFTPFFTTKVGGTGLGLATVHQIVEAHGGVVIAGACDPRGARFTIQLPDPAPPADLPAR